MYSFRASAAYLTVEQHRSSLTLIVGVALAFYASLLANPSATVHAIERVRARWLTARSQMKTRWADVLRRLRRRKVVGVSGRIVLTSTVSLTATAEVGRAADSALVRDIDRIGDIERRLSIIEPALVDTQTLLRVEIEARARGDRQALDSATTAVEELRRAVAGDRRQGDEWQASMIPSTLVAFLLTTLPDELAAALQAGAWALLVELALVLVWYSSRPARRAVIGELRAAHPR